MARICDEVGWSGDMGAVSSGEDWSGGEVATKKNCTTLSDFNFKIHLKKNWKVSSSLGTFKTLI